MDHSGYSRVRQLPSTVQRHPVSGIRLSGYSKWPTGVNVSVYGCFSFCLSPLTDWQPVQCVRRLPPYRNYDRLKPPYDFDKQNRMHGCTQMFPEMCC